MYAFVDGLVLHHAPAEHAVFILHTCLQFVATAHVGVLYVVLLKRLMRRVDSMLVGLVSLRLLRRRQRIKCTIEAISGLILARLVHLFL